MLLKNWLSVVWMLLNAILFFSSSAWAAGGESQTKEIVFTPQIGLVFGVLLLVIALFVFEWVRVYVVGILMMVLLPGINISHGCLDPI